jgi:hypothetical protein
VHYYSLQLIRYLNSGLFWHSHSFFYQGDGTAYESSRDPPWWWWPNYQLYASGIESQQLLGYALVSTAVLC